MNRSDVNIASLPKTKEFRVMRVVHTVRSDSGNETRQFLHVDVSLRSFGCHLVKNAFARTVAAAYRHPFEAFLRFAHSVKLKIVARRTNNPIYLNRTRESPTDQLAL